MSEATIKEIVEMICCTIAYVVSIVCFYYAVTRK